MTLSAYLAMPGLIGLVAVLIAVTTSVNPGKAFGADAAAKGE